MKISNHISYNEATVSQTALNRGIDNTPNQMALNCMKKVAESCFEPLRKWYGKPIRINSFYRSPELNTAIGGSANSQHSFGEAIDISTVNDNKILFDWLRKNVEFDQLLWEFGDNNNPAWIHISYTERRPNRQQVLRVVRENGKTVYKNM
jgi:zinc D-Ala-D-Ala carboxypeptidase